MRLDIDGLCAFVSEELAAAGNPADAGPMQAYMKTEMPFYGVKKPSRVPIRRGAKTRFVPAGHDEWTAGIRALWALPHREEKYHALEWGKDHRREHLSMASLPLVESLLREGAWWDLVDATVSYFVSPLALREPMSMRSVLERWIDDEDRWVRRAAIIAHNGHRDATDRARLFDFCRRRAHEKDFFIRKAIGWALRDHSRSAPDAVRAFLLAEKHVLSALSFREGAKHLRRQGLLD